MRRRYGIIAVTIIMLMISGVLLINKSSYADVPYVGDFCAARIYFITGDKAEVYEKNDDNIIDLPLGRLYTDIIDLSSSEHDYRLFVATNYLFNKYVYQSNDGSNKYTDYGLSSARLNRTNQYSVLMTYLIHDTHFSNDKNEDDYYKQLLVLWALDRLAGFEDDKNYDWNSEELPKDTTYDDKYDINRYDHSYESYVSYIWKYLNNLSAGDKELLISGKYGDKMLAYLDTWEDYVDWYLDGANVKLDSITQEDISYHVTNDYIETNLITPTSTGKVYSNKFDSYTVNVESPMVVVNHEGEEQKYFDAGESFRVRIPISEIKNKTLNYSIQVEGNFDFDVLQLYTGLEPSRYEMPSEERLRLYKQLQYTAVTRNCKITETLEDTLSLEFTQQVGNLDVKVIDSSTGNNLSRAEVAIFDGDGNEVYRYETTDDILHLTLPVGDYVVRQTITPDNYEATTIQMRVSVLANDTSEAVLENVPLVSVPDTLMNATIFIIIGGLIVVAGGIILFTNLRKKKDSH